jgi:hypothetical protein
MLRTSVLLLSLLASLPASAQPQIPTLPVRSGVIPPGTWVQYSLISRVTGQAALIRLAVLQKEGAGQWFEIAVTNERRQTLRTRTLVEGTLLAPKRVLKAIVQPPGQQPFILPDRLAVKQVPMFRSSSDGNAKLVSRGKIKVAAGTFVAARYRGVDAKKRVIESWVSDQIAGWPLVKLQTSDLIVELAAWGKNARSQIEGTPLKLDEKMLRGLPGAQ